MRSMVEGAKHGIGGELNWARYKGSDSGCIRPLHHFVVPLPRKRGRRILAKEKRPGLSTGAFSCSGLDAVAQTLQVGRGGLVR